MPAGKTSVKSKTPARQSARTADPVLPSAIAAAPDNTAAGAKVKPQGMKLKEFLTLVAAKTDAPKKAQREVSEAVLAVLGEAILAGEDINLPGLGRIRVVKSSDKSGSPVLTLKLKNAGQKKASTRKEPLAQSEEDS